MAKDQEWTDKVKEIEDLIRLAMTDAFLQYRETTERATINGATFPVFAKMATPAVMSIVNEKYAGFPQEWIPTEVHKKSGWRNNPKVLSEIVTNINDEIYVPDESELMEKIDLVLEWMKKRYTITKK